MEVKLVYSQHHFFPLLLPDNIPNKQHNLLLHKEMVQV